MWSCRKGRRNSRLGQVTTAWSVKEMWNAHFLTGCKFAQRKWLLVDKLKQPSFLPMPSLQISDENSKLSEQRLKIGTLLSDLKHHQLLHSREKHMASYRDRAQVDQQPVSPKNPKTPRPMLTQYTGLEESICYKPSIPTREHQSMLSHPSPIFT